MNVMGRSTLTDAELIAVCRSGDAAAFSTLAGRHYDAARGRARAILGDSAEAEDVVQEALLRAFLNLATLEQPERFRAWLNTIIYTSSMMCLRKARPSLPDADPDTLEIDASDGPHAESPEIPAARAESASRIHSAIGRLPAKYREPLSLYHLGGLSYRELFARLGLKLGTAQSLITRARQRLRSMLDPDLSGLSI